MQPNFEMAGDLRSLFQSPKDPQFVKGIRWLTRPHNTPSWFPTTFISKYTTNKFDTSSLSPLTASERDIPDICVILTSPAGNGNRS